MKYYARIDENGICIGIQEAPSIIENENMIEINIFDFSFMGKKWTGSEWVENPNPPEPQQEPDEQPSNQDIMDMLVSMQGEQISITTLDEAYREGVNSVG